MACGSSLRGLSLVTIDAIGERGGDRTHLRPLTAVAISAAAEDDGRAAASSFRAARATRSRARRACARNRRRRDAVAAEVVPCVPATAFSRAKTARTIASSTPKVCATPIAASAFHTLKRPGRRARTADRRRRNGVPSGSRRSPSERERAAVCRRRSPRVLRCQEFRAQRRP